jgi:hypothetical protein
MSTPADYEPIRLNLVAGVLAYLVPGAGHVYLGQTARGLVLGVGILALFFGGLFIGGLAVVDSKSGRLENRISFYGQAVVGPVAIAIDRVHQAAFKGYDPAQRRVRSLNPGEVRIAPGDPRNPNGFALIARADPARGEGPPYERSQGKVHEIGLLYTVLAGMLNFIVIVDAAFPGGRLRPEAARPGRGAAVAEPADRAGGVGP